MQLTELLGSLWMHISSKRKLQFGFLIILMIISSLAEIFSIGAVVPFLGALMSPEKLFTIPLIKNIAEYLNIIKPSQMVLPLTLIFGFLALVAGIMRLFLLYVSTKLSFSTGSDLSVDIYRKTLYQPYRVHMLRNSSEVIDAVSTKANGIIYNTITPFLMLISSSVILIFVLMAAILFQPKIALSIFFGFGCIYLVIIMLTKGKLTSNSKKMAYYSTSTIKSLQEGLGGIRDILIDGNQELYCQHYLRSEKELRQAQGSVQFISHSPRYVIEALGMILIAIVVFAISSNSYTEAVDSIPILGALALCAQRLLPLLQQSYLGWTSMRGSQHALHDTLQLLDQKLPDYLTGYKGEYLVFDKKIELKLLTFNFNDSTHPILKNINLSILKGSCIGIIGETGAGKSTILDLLMGLILPTSGEIEIDGQILGLKNIRSWQKKIAHVPQAIYLSDSTVAENIAFGVSKNKIDMNKVVRAAELAQIKTTIELWPNNYETLVGERGVRLSGGQRQRIGIARALYKNADVLILDEATSALDEGTEEKVMKSISDHYQNLTIFIVAHRLTTLKNCTEIIELQHGAVKWVGDYGAMNKRVGASESGH